MIPFARTMELRIPEPSCSPVISAMNPALPTFHLCPENIRAPFLLDVMDQGVARTVRRKIFSCPVIFSIAGRTYCSKVTMDDTGCPEVQRPVFSGTEGHGFPGTLRNLPELYFNPHILHDVFHKIIIPYRYSGRGDNDIGSRAAWNFRLWSSLVSFAIPSCRGTPPAFHHLRRERIAVAVDNLIG